MTECRFHAIMPAEHSQTTGSWRKSDRIAFVFVLCASVTAAWMVCRHRIPALGPLGWDESIHALYGLIIADDLRRLDWLGLLYDTYRQVYYPPLHSWLSGVVFLFAGPSDLAARAISAACLAATPPLLYLTARRMSPRHGVAAGLVAAWLAITSPALLRYSSFCLLEMPGVASVALTLFLWTHLTTRQSSPRCYMLVGLGILAAFFSKTNYGILLGLALAVSEICGSRAGFRNLLTKRHFYIGLPVVTALALWFAYPAKLRETWELLVNHPWGVRESYGIEGLLYFPRAFVTLSGSAWLALAFAVCLLAGCWRWSDPRIRLLVVLVTLQFVIGELHHTKLSRHLLPIYPAVFLLAGIAGAFCWHGPLSSRTGIRLWAGRLVVIAAAIHSATLPWHVPHSTDTRSYRELARKVAPVIKPPGKGLAVIPWQVCSPCVEWLLISEHAAMAPQQASAAAQRAQATKLAAALRRWRGPRFVAIMLLPTLERYTGEGDLPVVLRGDGVTLTLVAELSNRGDLDRLAILHVAPDSTSEQQPPLAASLLKRVCSHPMNLRTGGPFSGDVRTLHAKLDTYKK